MNGDQKTCQEYDTSFPDPNQTLQPSLRWPADLTGASISFNDIDVLDLSTFTAPIHYLNDPVGTFPGDVRWDLNGDGMINVLDMSTLSAGPTAYPAMLGGARAMNGPPCPWAP